MGKKKEPIFKNRDGSLHRLPYYAREDSKEILEEVIGLLKQLNLKYALVGGTCLGLIREHQFLRTEIDLDILVISEQSYWLFPRLEEDKKEELFRILEENGYVKKGWSSWRNTWFWKKGINLDIHTDIPPEFHHLFKILDITKYEGKTYTVPHPVGEYLTLQYGKNWMVEKEREDVLKVIRELKLTKRKEDLDPTFPHYAKEDADKVLNEFFDICKELDIPAFLWHGTALGLYRDKNYPRTDRDIDVGVKATSKQIGQLLTTLKARGFSKSPRVRGKYKIWLDISFRFCADEWDFLQNLDQIIYEGKTYNVPGPIENYLVWYLGKDWRTPRDKLANLKILIEYGFITKKELSQG